MFPIHPQPGQMIGPNQQNPDRGIETVLATTSVIVSPAVQTNRIPTEGLKQGYRMSDYTKSDLSKPTESRPRD